MQGRQGRQAQYECAQDRYRIPSKTFGTGKEFRMKKGETLGPCLKHAGIRA